MRITGSTLLLCLCASWVGAQETTDESLTAWKALDAEYAKARSDYYKPYYEARKKGESIKLDPAGHPDLQFAPRFAAFAEEHSGTEGALMALAALLRARTPNTNYGEWALKTILKDHIESESLVNIMFHIRSVRGPEGIAAYRVIATKSPHPRVRGMALLQVGQLKKNEAPDEAKAALREVVAKYADEEYYRGHKLGPAAEGVIFEIEHLAVGMTAPEIVGEDIDGVPMKLSDFRGKVVLLDFWGDW